MTIDELHQRQDWKLSQKIDHAVGAIEAFITFLKTVNKTPYVSFSGGRDSTVVLDIARRFVDKDIRGVFCNTGNEFPDIVKFVSNIDNVTVIRPKSTIPQIISRYGFPLISKEQSHGIRQCKTTTSEKLKNIRRYGTPGRKGYKAGKISDKWQFLINEPFMVSEQCCDVLKKAPFKTFDRQNNMAPILGIMTDESLLRKQQYIRRGGCNAFDMKRPACFPISIFRRADILEYIQTFQVPYCDIYNKKGVERTGCMMCGFGCHLPGDNRFEVLFDLYPKAYHLFMNCQNNGVTYRQVLRKCGICLPDEARQLTIDFE